MVLAVGETRLTTALQAAPARFLLHGDDVEHGGDDSGHGEAWGFPNRRREVAVRRLGFRDWTELSRERGIGELLRVL
jgi:hypothetical protein